MSFSCCIKCGKMVAQYDKYCEDCVNKYGVKQDKEFHKHFYPENYEEECKKEFSNDLLAAALGKKTMSKPILCLDFDGVCHLYTSEWKGAGAIEDDVVPGLFEFIEEASRHFNIQIYSTRSNKPGGVGAMIEWFYWQRKKWRENGGQGEEFIKLDFPMEKPPAFLTIDDRAITFNGQWPDIETLKNFKPWNRK